MRYREKLNIIVMRDNGPRRSYHIRRSNFFLLLLFFCCLPFFCLALGIQCWHLWQDNIIMRASLERNESEYQVMEARLERFLNLEELLTEDGLTGRDLIVRRLGYAGEPAASSEELAPNGKEWGEGPGHEDFPALETGKIRVDNVQVRSLRGNKVRIALDLRNPDNESVLSGKVLATLITEAGNPLNLQVMPPEAADFRISRFKRAVLVAAVPYNAQVNNSQIILEVEDQNKTPIYRNIFAVAH